MSNYLNDPLFLRQIIMDHYEYPRNHQLVNENNENQLHTSSESCIDDITVEIKVEDNVIKHTGFDGVACTIATASTSIMSELILNKTLNDAIVVIDNYLNMINEKPYDEDMLEEAIAFKTIYKQANRIKCATIGINGFKELIEKEKTI